MSLNISPASVWGILYGVKVWAECSAFLSLLGMTWLAANGPRKSREHDDGNNLAPIGS